MPKVPDPMSRHARRRMSENASASRVAEANEVWHSTAIDDSHLQFGEDSIGPGRSKSNKRRERGSVLQEENVVQIAANRGDDVGRSAEKNRCPPVVISASSGHQLFSSVLQRCGYIIKQPNSNNELFYDVMNFRKKLSDWLAENDDEMCRVETETSKFLKAVNGYLTEHFKLAMKPTKHDTELIQPSLLHCLLGIETLQPHLIKIVMPLLAEAALSASEDDAQLVNTILNQMKWLPSIVDGQKFADNLLSVVDNAVFVSQSQIIRELPNILPTNLHSNVAEKLLEKFNDEELQLNIALMDCLSSLEISEGYWSSIRNTAIAQMANAPLRDMPAYFSFVFRVGSISALNEVVSAIRENVQLKPDADTPRNQNHAYQVEILEKVGFCITVNPAIMNVWIKQVKDELQNGATEGIKKIDLLMLLLFVESHKSAIGVLKMLFAETKLSMDLFAQMMEENIAMANHLFPTLAKILDSYMRSKDPKSAETVQEITAQLFLGLSPMEAQTLMGNMTSILVNFPPSRDSVLAILTMLANRDPNKLLRFASYLMGVLEYVMQFPPMQIKALMNILAILSQTGGRISGESNHFNAEFSILLRKQLTHSDIKIRCFGVFGALATIKRIAEQSEPDMDRIKELLRLAWSTVERDEDGCAIFLDELSNCVNLLPMDFCRRFCEIFRDKFQKLWTIDAADAAKIQQFGQRSSLNLTAAFDANREVEEDRVLMIFENQLLEMSPCVIPSHIRALAILERKVKDGNLVGIDALLGCPLLFPNIEEYYEQDSMSLIGFNKRIHLGQYLLLAINFFRESVSAFVNEPGPELRIKIWLRLENILKLQKLLVRHFDSFPCLLHAYAADKAIGSSKDGAGSSGLQAFRMQKASKPGAKVGGTKASKAGAKGGGTKRKNPPKKSKSKKKKARRSSDDRQSDSESEEDDNPGTTTIASAPSKKKVLNRNLDEEIQPKKVLPHLRKFDKHVFRLLRYPLRCRSDESVNFSNILGNLSAFSQNPENLNEVEKFTPETLILMLTELKYQLVDDKSKQDIFSIKKFLQFICMHLNSIMEVLAENEENDMLRPEHQNKLECCLRLLIVLMTLYFEAIKKLEKGERDKKLQKAVEILACQNYPDAVMPSQSDLMADMSTFLGIFVSFIKDPATALDHMKLLKAIHDILDVKTELKEAIDKASRVYLQNKWKLPSSQVDGFLKIWLGTSSAPIKVIKHLSRSLLESEENSEGETKLPNSSTYTSCTDTNFHVWYNAMFSGLSQFVHKNLRRRGDFDDNIKLWTTATDIFHELVFVSYKTQRTLILASLLRNCRLFLEAFIGGGAELLLKYWSQDAGKARALCRTLQKPCRRIQYICDHSKKKNDMQLLKSVPLVKRVLETFIYRIREVLCSNGAAESFSMGSLSHRDLATDAHITSQISADYSVVFSSDDEDEDLGGDAPLSALGNESDATESERPDGSINEESMDVPESVTLSDEDSD